MGTFLHCEGTFPNVKGMPVTPEGVCPLTLEGGITMTNSNTFKRAEILIEALPYIQKLYGKTIVIKYGGNAMISEELKNSVMQDIILLKYVGMNPVVVHGGGPDLTNALQKLNIKSEFVNGLRVTSQSVIEVAQMVFIGKTNKEIVSLIEVPLKIGATI